MPYKRLLVFLLPLVFLCVGTNASCKSNYPRDYWLGVYYRNVKVGYLHVSVREEQRAGKRLVTLDEVLTIRAKYGARGIEADTFHTLTSDEAFSVATEKMGMGPFASSSVRPAFGVEITYKPFTIEMVFTEGSKARDQTIPFDRDDRLITASGRLYDLGIKRFSVGCNTTINHAVVLLKPTDKGMSPGFHAAKMAVSVPRMEQITADGRTYDTLVVLESGKLGKLTQWLLPNGDIVKISNSAEETVFIRESKGKATEIDKGEIPDLKPVVEK